MRTSSLRSLLAAVLTCAVVSVGAAEALPPAVQARVDEALKLVQGWAADPAIVNAVKAHNAGVSADHTAMTDAKWKTASILDPFVRGFAKNAPATFLKSRNNAAVSEAFLSGADGTKVAFLSKPTNWCHKGKPKHDEPMAGKTWQGPIEVDESTGTQQLQVAVPVLDGGKPIGSLVVGLRVLELSK